MKPVKEWWSGVGFGCLASLLLVILTGWLARVVVDVILSGKF